MISDEFILTPTDLDDTFSPPIIRAASQYDPTVLEAIIKHGASLDERQRLGHGVSYAPFWKSESLYLYFDLPLLEVIRAGHPANVAVLLEAGADPNGLSLEMLSRRSAQNLRFHQHKGHVTRNEGLKLISKPQSLPLTQKEVTIRRTTRARCWSAEKFVTTLFDPCTGPTALEAAAMAGSLEILDLILDAHPDINWWLADLSPRSIP